MDALAFQREVVSFHLGHQLGGMPPHGQAGHGNLETAVRRAAAGDRMRVLLYTVHVQADGFRAGTAHGVGYTRGIIGTVTAVLDGGRQVVTAERDRVTLFTLTYACFFCALPVVGSVVSAMT